MNKINIVKNVLGILVITVSLAVGSRAVYRWYTPKSSQAEDFDNGFVDLRIKGAIIDPEPLRIIKTGSYDFQTMIRLIDACRAVKVESEASFDEQKIIKPVDSDLVGALLKGLMRQRSSLRSYIWDLKGLSHTSIPAKKHRSLIYYLRVIDANIVEMRSLLAQATVKDDSKKNIKE